MSQLSVYSEISPLKKVLLHRPGTELNNLTPQNMHRLLFDDLPDLAGAVEEHDAFAQILESQGAEVLYIEKLLPEVLADDGLRCAFIEDFLSDAGFVLPGHGRDYLVDYLRSLDVETLIETTFAGIRKSDLPNYQPHSLSELLAVSQELLIDPMPNLYFQRDVFTTLGRGVSLNKMRTATRQRESIFPRYLFRHHPELKQTPIYFDPLQDSGFIEGGDILIFNSEVIGIGISERSSSEAIEILAERILRSEDGFKRVLAFKLPVERAFMHLDTVFTMLSHATFAIHQEPQRLFELYELSLNEKGALRTRALVGELSELLAKAFEVEEVRFIHCGAGHPIDAAREQWNDASNTLALAPGEVVVYDRNHVTNEILDRAGIRLHVMRSAELSRGRGGPRCMSMPLLRES
ncbi:MAG: arginine deiminase [Eubacteriales bacterium]|nr:arginine deiminase [Eubacteriales bacterium]